MSFWDRLTGGKPKPPAENLDYLNEALAIERQLSGAHYGLAFLLLRRGDVSDAAFHLEAFLMDPPRSQEAERWVKHAQKTLDEMKGAEPPPQSPNSTPASSSPTSTLKSNEYPGIVE